MNPLQKLAWANAETRFESDGEPPCLEPGRRTAERHGYTEKQIRERYGREPRIQARGHEIPIYMAAGGAGRRIPLLKSMLTTACERDCNYCAFRTQRNYRRVTFKPAELAKTYHDAYQAGWVDGLFLSTGVFAGGIHTQDKLIETATVLRKIHDYRGYLHLKIMPGAERDQVRQAMYLANRVSVNLEAPDQDHLNFLAPQKQFHRELLQPLIWAEAIRTEERFQPTPWSSRWASSSTQFVVGAAGESDLEILATVDALFRSARLRRAYFEAFNPVVDTPFENLPPEKPLRQHRLYQASYLLRDYGFDLEELPFRSNGQLPIEYDPKQAYAEMHFRQEPPDINQASRATLLRIPGIGSRSAEAILQARKQHQLSELGQLRRLGIAVERTAPYILLNGKCPDQQMSLFPH